MEIDIILICSYTRNRSLQTGPVRTYAMYIYFCVDSAWQPRFRIMSISIVTGQDARWIIIYVSNFIIIFHLFAVTVWILETLNLSLSAYFDAHIALWLFSYVTKLFCFTLLLPLFSIYLTRTHTHTHLPHRKMSRKQEKATIFMRLVQIFWFINIHTYSTYHT